MRVIILAAGRGSRLGRLTDNQPKPMVMVGGEPLLSRTIRLLEPYASNGIVVVGGYRSDALCTQGHTLVHNARWETQNILGSLFSAAPYLNGELLVTYGDTCLSPAIVHAAVEAPTSEIDLVADVSWRDAYVGRSRHPMSEAEKMVVHESVIIRIGKKNVEADEATAEFTGLMRLSSEGATMLVAAYRAAVRRRGAASFVTAPSVETAYLTDLIQFMIERGTVVCARLVTGGWREIDTPEDLLRAERWYETLS